jgi:uncharacterized membrane protein YhiD involved in acid resistance
MKRSRLAALIVVIAALLLTLVLYLSRDRFVASEGGPAPTPAPTQITEAGTPSDEENPFLAALTDPTPTNPPDTPETWIDATTQIVFRLFLAVVLAGVLAFRPRQDINLFRRSLFVSQTQILLAVVAASLMMIVGDNAARAFAIFAAVSLVRFRTNIRDPKEVTVLLISLALGLAAGVGRWELGVALCVFALALLWLLEYNESEQVYRSMELTVKTKDTDKAKHALARIFRKYKIDAEVREFDPPDESNAVGSVVYYITLRLNLSTDRLSEQIMRADPTNIESIQWSQKKGASQIYQ